MANVCCAPSLAESSRCNSDVFSLSAEMAGFRLVPGYIFGLDFPSDSSVFRGIFGEGIHPGDFSYAVVGPKVSSDRIANFCNASALISENAGGDARIVVPCKIYSDSSGFDIYGRSSGGGLENVRPVELLDEEFVDVYNILHRRKNPYLLG